MHKSLCESRVFEYMWRCVNDYVCSCDIWWWWRGVNVIYIWFGDKMMMWILVIFCVDDFRINMFVDWIRPHVMIEIREWICISICDVLIPKYYAWVRILFMLNVYLTLRWLFGRLHPRGVDMQVEDAWSAWVPEDGLMHILLSCFWSLSGSALIRCRGFFFLFLFVRLVFWGTIEFSWWCIEIMRW